MSKGPKQSAKPIQLLSRVALDSIIQKYNPTFDFNPTTSILYRDTIQFTKVEPILQKDPKERTSDELDFLANEFSKMSFLEKIKVTVDARWDFCKAVTLRKYPNVGENVIVQGDEGDSFFIILSGAMKVFRTFPDGTTKEVAQLSSGDTFGELSLLHAKPRAATVTVDQPSMCIVAVKSDYDTLVRPWHEKQEREISNFLLHMSAFRKWGEEKTQLLANKIAVRKFHPGEPILREGQPATDLIFVSKGEVRVLRKVLAKIAAGLTEEEKIILEKEDVLLSSVPVGELWRGDVVDPPAIFGKKNWSYSLYAVTMVSMYFLPGVEVPRLIDAETISRLKNKTQVFAHNEDLEEIAKGERKWKEYRRDVCADVLTHTSNGHLLAPKDSTDYVGVFSGKKSLPSESDSVPPPWTKHCLSVSSSPPRSLSSKSLPRLSLPSSPLSLSISSPPATDPSDSKNSKNSKNIQTVFPFLVAKDKHSPSPTRSPPRRVRLSRRDKSEDFSHFGWCHPDRADRDVAFLKRRRNKDENNDGESDDEKSDENESDPTGERASRESVEKSERHSFSGVSQRKIPALSWEEFSRMMTPVAGEASIFMSAVGDLAGKIKGDDIPSDDDDDDSDPSRRKISMKMEKNQSAIKSVGFLPSIVK